MSEEGAILDELALRELDAMPPDRLVELVDTAIIENIDPVAWEKEQAVEESEREILARMVGAR